MYNILYKIEKKVWTRSGTGSDQICIKISAYDRSTVSGMDQAEFESMYADYMRSMLEPQQK